MLFNHLHIFFGKVYIQIFFQLYNSLCFYYCVVKFFFIYFRYKSGIRYLFYKYFFPVCNLSFSSDSNFLRREVLTWIKTNLCIFFLFWFIFLFCHKKFSLMQGHKNYHLFFPLTSFTSIALPFMSPVNIKLVLHVSI